MTRSIRALIVDDEKPARQALKNELQKFPEVEVVGECGDGFAAVKAVQELTPDLLFLDIQMPRLDGFDVLELLGAAAPAVVFVTAHDEYALRAFEARALDYLLKPVRGERLKQALERIRQALKHSTATARSALLEDHRRRQAPLQRILVRLGTEVHVVATAEISLFEAEDDYVRIHAPGNRTFLKSERLNRLEELLDPRQFCRIHRSYILNVNFLAKIEPWSRDRRIAKLTDGRILPISREGYARLKELLK